MYCTLDQVEIRNQFSLNHRDFEVELPSADSIELVDKADQTYLAYVAKEDNAAYLIQLVWDLGPNGDERVTAFANGSPVGWAYGGGMDIRPEALWPWLKEKANAKLQGWSGTLYGQPGITMIGPFDTNPDRPDEDFYDVEWEFEVTLTIDVEVTPLAVEMALDSLLGAWDQHRSHEIAWNDENDPPTEGVLTLEFGAPSGDEGRAEDYVSTTMEEAVRKIYDLVSFEVREVSEV